MIIPLDHLTIIEVFGQNPDKFLQGQLPCDINAIQEEHGIMTALCNLKGNIIALIYVLRQHNKFYLILPKNLSDQVIKTLTAVAKLSRIELKLNENLYVAGILSNNLQRITIKDTPIAITATHQDLLNQWHITDLENNHPWIYPQTSEQFSPFDLGLQNTAGISFTKGCYRGQEIIARIHYLAKYKYKYETIIIPRSNTSIIPGQELILPKSTKPVTIIDWCPLDHNQIILGVRASQDD